MNEHFSSQKELVPTPKHLWDNGWLRGAPPTSWDTSMLEKNKNNYSHIELGPQDHRLQLWVPSQNKKFHLFNEQSVEEGVWMLLEASAKLWYRNENNSQMGAW